MLDEKTRKALYDNGQLNLQRLLDIAKIQNASHENYDKTKYAPLWYFHFPFVEHGLPSLIGEHGNTAEEAKAKVLVRLQRGYPNGSYAADETIEANKKAAADEDTRITEAAKKGKVIEPSDWRNHPSKRII